MTNEQLKNLKDTLWSTADQLRANSGLKSTEYATPILGLIFLRFAESKYTQYEADIQAEYNKNKGKRAERPIHEIAIEKCGYYLPDEARYSYLLNLSEDTNLAEKVKNAMIKLEKYTVELAGTLPKDEYYRVNSEDDPLVLAKLLKAFKDIPTDVSLDIFGEIYEYFLGEFALAEGQGGGEFFTPSTVVRYMVEVLAPAEGKILDPACGSGGMFVQTAHYITRHRKKGRDINLRAYGVEKTAATVRLAKMNLILNNVRGEIVEANSYYRDPHNSLGAFDYVMANPPFNVDEVELDQVINQPRFNSYGVPRNKTKQKKKDAKETVPNANYLWINLFATSLNDQGRAALVMANSASDAGHSEKDIRIKLIESGVISQMVTLPTNMFSSVTLPATLWFFDKAKHKKDEILFIDARNIFTQVDRAHRKFSDEQIKNLGIITRLYEGKTDEYKALLDEYKAAKEKAKDKEEKAYWQSNIDWLTERFPRGKYADVIGLCKAAKIKGEDGIKDQDYSLNPGRYVGVVIEDDGMTEAEFKNEMLNLNEELSKLNDEAKKLEKKIRVNLQELVGSK
ncbi:putatIve type i restriction enzyme hindviip m protein (m.hindviip) [Treponema primitia ZAS-2]|uniref:site-specific DNA-methyltransferase (adenine-specific) n=1 Tax=Treponema primitia (strain ATCC BAA-887 / DSM 12427 / ZAS-2) TaxID=545694 RepID=F5YQK1_TREPZ|nr:class I SAM-dependent DNA methyltransferase [Treponema primitia]AEF86250.1 putatIve type i restriction enzyme hindviip m protein (m.hindviip) [Treponema primitia ZAS-2]